MIIQKAGDLIDGRYQIVEHLNSGGMGHVYLVADSHERGNKYAVKIMEDTQSDPSLRMRFMQEAETLQRLDHPHVVSYLRMGMPKKGPPYLVMEYLPGGNLKNLLSQAKAQPKTPFRLSSGLTDGLALKLFAQCVDGLCAIHAGGITHRDLKPANLLLKESADTILIEEECTLKLADFGISARHSQGQPTLTRAGSFLGTMPYAAPEHLRHVIKFQEEPDSHWERSPQEEMKGDIFALGLILYEMWVGESFVPEVIQRKVAGGTQNREKASLKALEEALSDFNKLHDQLPHKSPILSLVRDLLASDPHLRPTAEEVLRRVRGLQRGEAPGGSHTFGSTGASGAEPLPRPQPAAGRHPPPPSSRFAFLLPLVVGFGVGWLGHSQWLPNVPVQQTTYTRSSAQMIPGVPQPVAQLAPAVNPTPTRVSPNPVLPDPAPTTAPPPPTPAPTPSPTLAPPSPTPGTTMTQVPAANTKVSCRAKPAEFPQEWEALQVGIGSPVAPPPLRCYHDGKGGVYVRWDEKMGTEVKAPAPGKVRIWDGLFAGSLQDKATCLTLDHGGGRWSRLCGLDSKHLSVKKNDVVAAGAGLGSLNASARLTWEIYQTNDPDGKADKNPQDVRLLLK